MSTLISVIVPIYNGERYLRPCLDSLAAQTYQNMEFVLVDDGSQDGSGAICEEYAVRHKRFRVIHKANAGVSAARNTGLDAAVGEYIGFLDADDAIRPEMFADMLSFAKAHDVDIVVCDSEALEEGKMPVSESLHSFPESCLLKREEVLPEQLMEMAGSVCRCLYRRELLRENNIRFPEGLRFSEDRIFNIYAMGAAERIYYAKSVYYERLLHGESAVHRSYPDYFEIVKDAAQCTREALAAAWDNDERFQNAYLAQFVDGAIAAVNNYFYRSSTLTARQRWARVKSVCNDEHLREAIRRSGRGGVRGRWIIKKRALLLCLCAQVLNWKYGR